MDNLAHSFVGAVVGCALAPELASKHRRRLLVASALVANSPDLDILLLSLGQNTYMFHHRGFTHSLLGLTVMVPLALFLFSRIMGRERLAGEDGQVAWGTWAFFVLAQLLFSHYFLDFLTAYGTLFLYPFSWQRFSYPLMFILDPALWLISGLGFLVLFYKNLSAPRRIAQVAWVTLLALAGLWGVELAAKFQAEELYRARRPQAPTLSRTAELSSYPAPLAPFFWLLLEKLELDAQAGSAPSVSAQTMSVSSRALADERLASPYVYRQAAVSYLGKNGRGATTWWQEPMPEGYEHGAFCHEWRDQAAAYAEFQRFASWAEHFVCGPFLWQGQQGCRCVSLKYSLLALGSVSYGAYWISPAGDGVFLPADDRRLTLKSLRHFLPVPD